MRGDAAARWMLLVGVLLLAACPDEAPPAEQREQAAVGVQGPGVDPDARVLRLGALNDESGPAADIGRAYAAGKRILAARVNAGGSGLLPEGWRVLLVERDHGYRPRRAVQAYRELRDQVLFFATSFGTPTTLAIRPLLERDRIIAFPGSLSAELAGSEFTPPIGTPYRVEAMRAMDWVVESAEAPEAVRAGVVYQLDDYGRGALEGWKQAARHHGVQVVAEQALSPGEADPLAVIGALQDAGANHVLLAVLPDATAALLEAAAARDYAPGWVGSTPAWADRLFDAPQLPARALKDFRWATGLPYWGEDVPGMDAFLQAYERHGQDLTEPDVHALLSYAQGLVALEAVRRAMAEGPLTRETYRAALHTLTAFQPDGGLLPPVDLSRVPYRMQQVARVLEPLPSTRSWRVVAEAARPKALPQTRAEPGRPRTR